MKLLIVKLEHLKSQKKRLPSFVGLFLLVIKVLLKTPSYPARFAFSNYILEIFILVKILFLLKV